ncbi:MAG: bifunctional phosphopantothenoylcysteine decarboxylase/phosphopantothenate--cysteine ligase CoaBC [Bowdeniella nasicola]|nr:bifunctional phosphopantothenoylcysteine decarboxylase/phosphopantothenate--cysteine ligase CoaBC [Bowdeniella nasicola]
MTSPSRPRTIVLGVCGGIAAYKAVHVLRGLAEAGHDVHVVPTSSALRMVGTATWQALSHHRIGTEVFDHSENVDHVELGQRADLVLVVPATAHTIAKLAAGFADNLLTATALATRAPLAICPAMHTEMWQHPAVQANLETLRQRGAVIMPPATGRLTGRDSGPGRLPEPEQILAFATGLLEPAIPELAGLRVLVSAGGTREALDPVRYLANRSSGRQGVALANVAARSGAEVHLLAANISPQVRARLAPEVRVVDVESAAELNAHVHAEAPRCDVLIMAAAVADYRPREVGRYKHKKAGAESLTLELVPNPDILASVVQAAYTGLTVVGFAAETGDETSDALTHGRRKAARKGAHLLAINDVSAGQGFGRETNHVTIVRPDGQCVAEGGGTKDDVARLLWRAVIEERAASSESERSARDR